MQKAFERFRRVADDGEVECLLDTLALLLEKVCGACCVLCSAHTDACSALHLQSVDVKDELRRKNMFRRVTKKYLRHQRKQRRVGAIQIDSEELSERCAGRRSVPATASYTRPLLRSVEYGDVEMQPLARKGTATQRDSSSCSNGGDLSMSGARDKPAGTARSYGRIGSDKSLKSEVARASDACAFQLIPCVCVCCV